MSCCASARGGRWWKPCRMNVARRVGNRSSASKRAASIACLGGAGRAESPEPRSAERACILTDSGRRAVAMEATRDYGGAVFRREARGMMLLAVIMPVGALLMALITPPLLQLLTGR